MNCPKCGENGFMMRMKVVELGSDVTQCGKCHACWMQSTKATSPIFDSFSSFLKFHGYEYGHVEVEGIRVICQMCNGNGEILNIKIPRMNIVLRVCNYCDACWTPDQPYKHLTSKTLLTFLKNHNLNSKDIINEGKKILCPCCDGQGEVYKAKIIDLNLELRICDECEACWMNDQRISSALPGCLISFLEEHGLQYGQATIERY